MQNESDGQLPDDLAPVARRLEQSRAEVDPLTLDQIKMRAMTRARNQPRRTTLMKSRIATIFAVAALCGGTGGALAVAGGFSSNSGRGSASWNEYCGHHHRAGEKDCKAHRDNDGDYDGIGRDQRDSRGEHDRGQNQAQQQSKHGHSSRKH
jgi:hypothetical protein